MVHRSVAALTLGLLCGCDEDVGECGGLVAPIAIESSGETSFALRLWLESSRVPSVEFRLGRGEMVNRSTDNDCNAALYLFSSPPERAALPALEVGAVAPAELPGGGVLLEQHFLPRTGEHRFKVLFKEQSYLALTQDTWLVGLTCPTAELAIEFVWDVFACTDDDVPPGPGEMGVERLW